MEENDILAELSETLKQQDELLGKATTIQGALDALQQLNNSLCNIASVICSGILPITKELAETEEWKNASEAAEYITSNVDYLNSIMAEFNELKPYIEQVMQQPEFAGKPITEMLSLQPGQEHCLWQDVITAARAKRDESIPRIVQKEVKKVDYPIDKINNKLWNFFTEIKPNGQLYYKFDTATDRDRKAQKDVNVIVSLNFDDVLLDETVSKQIKQLTPFDKRVYIALAALFNAGNEIVAVTNVYEAMGGTRKPNSSDIDKIIQAIVKMNAAQMSYSNKDEQKHYSKMMYDEYHGSLLPLEWIVSYVNGKKTDAAIHIFREPPLVSFARKRKQITSFPHKLLCSPVSKTNAHIIIEDALLELSAAAKKGSINSFITWEKLHERCKITSRMQKSRFPDIVQRYLDHFKKCKHIKNYVMDERGVTFIFQ